MQSAMERIVLGADHAGYRLKERIAEHLRGKGYAVEDIGCHSEDSVDYPSFAQKLAEKMKELQTAGGGPVWGVLCCGSGIGICMSANRFPWVRAVEAHDHNTAMMSRRHNDANVLSMGGRVLAPELACDILDTWLATAFEGGRHQKRVDLMSSITVGNEVPSC